MKATHAAGLGQNPAPIARDRARYALDWLHGLLIGTAPTSLTSGLAELVEVFDAQAGGFAVCLDGSVLQKHWHTRADCQVPVTCWPWEVDRSLLLNQRTSSAPLEIGTSSKSKLLLAQASKVDEIRWLVWLEGASDRTWQAGERSCLNLATELLERMCGSEDRATHQKAIEHKRIQRYLEQAAAVTGRVAHDFGNVLTAVLGYAELALPQLAPGSTPHQHVTEMYQAAQQGAQMIRKLSQFSRRRPSGSHVASLQTAVSGEIARVQKTWQPAVSLKVDLPSRLPAVAIDSDSLRVVLEQALDNAREAIRGEGAVTVTARAVDLSEGCCQDLLGSAAPGPALEVTITDTGSGIAPDIYRRLFKEVFVTTKPGRRGLGLAAVYGILQANRGGLQIETSLGGGTTVRFVLPQAAAAAAESQARPQTATRERILVVDDDPLVLEMIGTVLGQEGYRVQRAPGGAEALQHYRTAGSEPFGLVVSDVMMPEMTGFDLARKLQHEDPNANIMFITGHASARPLLEDRTLRQAAVLPKPFRPDALTRAVRAALDRGTVRGGSAPRMTEEPPKKSLLTCSRR